MTEPCAFLPWDSEFFGHRIARVEGGGLTLARQDAIDNWCAAHEIACLYFLADLEDGVTTRLAEKSGYHLVDIRVTLHCRPEKAMMTAMRDGAISVRMAQEADIPSLIELSSNQFVDSRFYQDPCFDRERCGALYSVWIAKGSRAEGADMTLVAELEEKPVGYLIISHHAEQGIGQFSLMAVKPSAHGLGIGSLLVNEGIRIFRQRNVQELRIVTQGRNIKSQQLYQKFGFRTMQTQLWYHKWYSGCAANE